MNEWIPSDQKDMITGAPLKIKDSYILPLPQRMLYLNIQHESELFFFIPKIHCCNNVLN